jgi:hypothetical protein
MTSVVCKLNNEQLHDAKRMGLSQYRDIDGGGAYVAQTWNSSGRNIPFPGEIVFNNGQGADTSTSANNDGDSSTSPEDSRTIHSQSLAGPK